MAESAGFHDEIMVADLPNGATIIVAYPHQQIPDEEELRKLFGITRSMVVPLSKSRARPSTPAEKQAARARQAAAEAETSRRVAAQG